MPFAVLVEEADGLGGSPGNHATWDTCGGAVWRLYLKVNYFHCHLPDGACVLHIIHMSAVCWLCLVITTCSLAVSACSEIDLSSLWVAHFIFCLNLSFFVKVLTCSQRWVLVAWHSGRTSVFGQRTFSVLRSTCSWWVTTYVGKPSAIGQPTRPTKAFILSWSIN